MQVNDFVRATLESSRAARHQNPDVEEGDEVEAGDILANGDLNPERFTDCELKEGIIDGMAEGIFCNEMS